MIDNLKSIAEWVKRNAIVAVGSGAIGFFASQYMDFRAEYREALNSNYQQFDAAAKEINVSLKEFADIARGQKKKSEEQIASLQNRLLVGVNAADDLQRRVNAPADVIDGYRKAAVKLKHASDNVTGPADAKPLVLAVDEYLVAEQRLRDVVIDEQTSFIW